MLEPAKIDQYRNISPPPNGDFRVKKNIGFATLYCTRRVAILSGGGWFCRVVQAGWMWNMHEPTSWGSLSPRSIAKQSANAHPSSSSPSPTPTPSPPPPSPPPPPPPPPSSSAASSSASISTSTSASSLHYRYPHAGDALMFCRSTNFSCREPLARWRALQRPAAVLFACWASWSLSRTRHAKTGKIQKEFRL